MTALSVNVNKVAWLRNARGGSRPDLSETTRTVIKAGANGITVHPRPDQRHIRPQDVIDIQAVISATNDVEFNIEGNPTAEPRENGYPGFYQLVEAAKPDQCTLVPDTEHQLTSDHGWELRESTTFDSVRSIIAKYQDLGTRVSLFIDPDPDQISRARDVGADRIELYTGPYADSVATYGIDSEEAGKQWELYRRAVIHAKERGLGINAGHDLNLTNLARFCSIGNINEVSIGHALIADALELGLTITIKRYLEALDMAASDARVPLA
mgnify:FL=1